jgi:hypothetical protein
MLVQLDCTRVQKARTDAKIRVEVGNSCTYMELFGRFSVVFIAVPNLL